MLTKILKIFLGLALPGYMGLLFYLSSIPGTEITIQTPDYILHALAFGGLSVLFMANILIHTQKDKVNLLKSMIISTILTSFYGLLDEFHQSFVPGRTPDWHDILADLVGAILFQLGLIILLHLFYHYRGVQPKE